MDKELFESLSKGLKQAEDFKAGKLNLHSYNARIKIPDVKAIRQRMGLTQQVFARMFGWSKETVAAWEQEKRAPEHSARVMLKLIDADPEYVLEVMRA
jgi:putative transcriptional regulator